MKSAWALVPSRIVTVVVVVVVIVPGPVAALVIPNETLAVIPPSWSSTQASPRNHTTRTKHIALLEQLLQARQEQVANLLKDVLL